MAAVTEILTQNMEMHHPNIEIVNFTTAAPGDTYDSKKFGQIEATFASQQTADGNEIQTVASTLVNGQQRVTISPETAGTTGWLVIFGRK